MYKEVESLTDIDTYFLKQLWTTSHETTCTLWNVNPLKAELNPICHLLALLGAHYILHVSRIRIKLHYCMEKNLLLNFALKPGNSAHCSCYIFYIPKSTLQYPK